MLLSDGALQDGEAHQLVAAFGKSHQMERQCGRSSSRAAPLLLAARPPASSAAACSSSDRTH